MLPVGLRVWMARLSDVEGQAMYWTRVLSPDEARRATRMPDEAVRRRFVVGRGLLRALLAEEMDVAPERIRFDYTGTGKPRLAAGDINPALPVAFNVSHSGDRIVFAVSSNEVGVDIEGTGRRRACDRIVRRFATPRERDEYLSLPPGQRDEAFYRWWTRKEALIKALGTGLARGLAAASVSFDEKSLCAVDVPPGSSWLIATVKPEEGYWMSVARPAATDVLETSFQLFPAAQSPNRHPRLPLTLLLRW